MHKHNALPSSLPVSNGGGRCCRRVRSGVHDRAPGDVCTHPDVFFLASSSSKYVSRSFFASNAYKVACSLDKYETTKAPHSDVSRELPECLCSCSVSCEQLHSLWCVTRQPMKYLVVLSHCHHDRRIVEIHDSLHPSRPSMKSPFPAEFMHSCTLVLSLVPGWKESGRPHPYVRDCSR